MYEFDAANNDGQFDDAREYDDSRSATDDTGESEGRWDAVTAEDPDSEDSEIDDDQPDLDVSAGRMTVKDREIQPRLQISSPEEFTAEVKRLGEAVAAETVVIGSSAAYMALGDAVRPPRDVDLSVSPEAYAYLRDQPGWQEREGRIFNGSYDVGMTWGSKSQADLEQRSWQTSDGIKVASLSDVVTWKTWERGEPKDLADVEAIRSRLLDPTKAPLPAGMLADEIAVAKSCLPEHLRDDPNAQVAVELAANGLATVRTLYGDDRIGQPNRIVGDLERPEYAVTALYHNGLGLSDDMHQLQQHMENIGATDEQRLEAMVADAYSDIVYGGGRKSDNPDGYDELRSANLLGAHAAMKGYGEAKVERHRQSVLGTGFSEQTGQQAGQHHPDPVVRAVAGIDLQGLSEPEALISSVDISVEDGMSARFSPARTIGQAAVEQNARISSTPEGLRFIDENPDLKPRNAPDGPTVREAFGRRLAGNAGFTDPATGYTPPDGWTLENKERRTVNADKLRDLSSRLLAGEITAQQVYEEAHAHRDRMATE